MEYIDSLFNEYLSLILITIGVLLLVSTMYFDNIAIHTRNTTHKKLLNVTSIITLVFALASCMVALFLEF